MQIGAAIVTVLASIATLKLSPAERADPDFAVHRNDTAFGARSHDDMATGLTNFRKPQSFKRPP